MLSLLRQRNYALLWSGAAISQIGTFMLIAALPYYVYATSRSVTASGTAIVSEILPGVLFNAIGGVYADRLPRKVVMAAGNGSRGLVILPLLAVHGPSTIWIVYLVGFLNQTIAALAGPFGSAALPHIVRSEDLPAANGAFSVATNVGMLVGSPLGGFLLQRSGLSAVVLVDALSFVVPTVTISLINVALEDRPRQEGGRAAHVRELVREWLLGWRYAWQTPLLARLFLLTILTSLANGVFFVAFAPFVRRVLAGSAEFYSWSLTLQAASAVAGGVMIGTISKRVGSRVLVSSGLLFLGLITLVEVALARQSVTLAISAAVGFPVVFIGANLNTLLQSGSADAYRGRVYGSYITATALMVLIGTIGTTLATDHIGIRVMFGVAGLILTLAGLTAMKVLPVSGSSSS